MMTAAGVALQDFLVKLVDDPSLFPIYDANGELLETFCNYGAMRCPPGETFNEFSQDDDADRMFAIMDANVSGKWKKASGADAQAWAEQGRRAHGALPSYILKQAHGHIVRICPLPMMESGELGHAVPQCANVGPGNPSKPLAPFNEGRNKTRPNWICGTNWAFPPAIGECEYFLYYGT